MNTTGSTNTTGPSQATGSPTTPHTAEATFAVESWTESAIYTAGGDTIEINGNPYPAHGFTRVEAGYRYTGSISGAGIVAYLITYIAGQSAPTSGFQAFTGEIDGRSGTVVFRHDGHHDAVGVHERLEIVPGLGTEELAGIRGHAEVEIGGHSDTGYRITLHYRFE